jgi:hypothetical protein
VTVSLSMSIMTPVLFLGLPAGFCFPFIINLVVEDIFSPVLNTVALTANGSLFQFAALSRFDKPRLTAVTNCESAIYNFILSANNVDVREFKGRSTSRLSQLTANIG